MTWTKDPPTAPGWYWVRGVGDGEDGIVLVKSGFDGRLTTFAHGHAQDVTVARMCERGAEWCGPLVPPEVVKRVEWRTA